MKRNIGIDILRIIAYVGVLTLHIFGPNKDITNSVLYYSATISIPIFFMISRIFIIF